VFVAFGSFKRLLPLRRSPIRVLGSGAQAPDHNLDVVALNQCLVKLRLPDIPASALEAPIIMWTLATSTDTEVFLAAASLVPDVDWPLDLNVSDTLRQLYDVYTTCLDVHGRIIPSLEEKASTCTMALCHLYCHRILQAGPYGFLGVGSGDDFVFDRMLDRTKVNPNVLLATTKLYKLSAGRPSSWKFGVCSNSNLEWLSHVLPFHFVTGRVDEDVENLAITVISKLSCSPSSPSPQNIANCTLLACIMVRVRFDKKDIVRVDKRCYRLI
jgi:hypothetical protein